MNQKFSTFQRSLPACMVDAWKIFTLNWKAFLSFQFPFLLLSGLSAALFIYSLLKLYNTLLLPTFTLYKEGIPLPHILEQVQYPGTQSIITLTLSLIFYLLGYLFSKGKLLTQIKEYKESRKFPKRKSFRYLKEIGRLGTSTLVISFVYLLVACIISGVFCTLALRVSLWFLILPLPIYLYISISLYRAKVFKAIGNVSTSNSIIQGLFRIKGWSKSSLLIFISGIPTCLVLLILNTPVLALALSSVAYAKAEILSESVTQSTTFTFVFIGTATFSFTLSRFAIEFQYWMLALQLLPKEENSKQSLGIDLL